MTVFAPAIGSFVDLLRAHDMDPAPFFVTEGLEPDVVFDSNARLPAGVADRLAVAAAQAAGREDFSLQEGDHLQAGHLGALGFAWLASPTLRAALDRLIRFEALVNEQLKITMEEDRETTRLAIAFLDASEDPSVREDASLSSLLAMLSMVLGQDFHPAAAYFQRPAPQDSAPWFERFRCPVHFEAEHSALTFPSALLDERLSGGNEQIATMNDHLAVKYLAWHDRHDVVNRVRTWILEHLADGEVSEQAAAEALATSPRNLNRKLQEQDTSFKELLNELRQSLAEQYIADQTLTLTEISFLLGFSEASSFSRAFKRWTGQSPSDARGTS